MPNHAPSTLTNTHPTTKISKLTKYTLFLAKNHDEIKKKSNQNQTSDAYDHRLRRRDSRRDGDSDRRGRFRGRFGDADGRFGFFRYD